MKKFNFALALFALPLMHSTCIQAYALKSIMKNYSGKNSTAVQIFNEHDDVTGEINTPKAGVQGMTQGASKDFWHDEIAKFVVWDVENGKLVNQVVTMATEMQNMPINNGVINRNGAFFIDTDKKVKNSLNNNCKTAVVDDEPQHPNANSHNEMF